ncbi:hypothetical protein CC86DRAFT_291154 [Ophiobolus disseminans]|uniref:F-box domain-containing protein n=1 Tax=Ophiobolus disseminans TaxID=1469910 RepID=A0A6A7A235_9PLEO|nr:hypothetical protein CC86DRAFT_291154 [Ophiobolus disseminans]
MEDKSGLLRLPLVILQLIFEESGRTAFFNIRLVSRACRNESEYLFFRSVALYDDTRIAKTFSMELISRIELLGKHVRHLTIGPFADEEWFYFTLTPLLEDVLKSLETLQSLTWNSERAIRPDILRTFHERHPSAKLQLMLKDRSLTPLSSTLLSSPQLHSLDISIYCVRGSATCGHSEAEFIKQSIAKSSLKVLSLAVKSLASPIQRRMFLQWDYVRYGFFNFNLQEGDRFPALEELRLGYDMNNVLTAENCEMWAKATSWHQLRKLDLSRGSPRHFLASLTDRAPNLESLKFGLNRPHSRTADLHPLHIGLPSLVGFIASITALRELDFGAHKMEHFMAVLPLMLENSKGSLRKLIIHCRFHEENVWQAEQYVDVLTQAPGLEYLKAQIQEDTVEGSWVGSARFMHPREKYQTAVKDLYEYPAGRHLQRGQRVRRLDLDD